ncbi:hypothetical protein [Phenylobacterium sp.]|jgi:hypothetical protein|uniref:hypothetical protein n=1 Tax=Phenylobacterium sp. TaxID=1871053 RepID=UPI002F4136D7
MNTSLTLGLAGALALSGAAPALAQYGGDSSYQYQRGQYESGSPYQPTDQYRQDLQRYDNDRADYQSRRIDYQQARRDYDRQRADYDRARAEYDARFGLGAYAQRYGPAPVWDETRWANAYGRDAAYTDAVDACRSQRSNGAVAGGVIGALAGAALGSNVAARNARPEGAVLGAVVGGAIGAGVGRASAKCDPRGYYFSYSDTIPYRESGFDRRGRSGRYGYDYYARERCRLAPAPVDWGDRTEYRYVRVCPDTDGRYRITG